MNRDPKHPNAVARWMPAVLLLTACVMLGLAGRMKAQQNPIPATFTNLQVMPKDIPRSQLVPAMQGFTRGLGVRCEHCHMGEGNDLSTFDFASDARPAKVVTRKMMAMVQAINGPLLNGVGAPAKPDSPKVTCFTCHRGAATPLTAPGGRGLE